MHICDIFDQLYRPSIVYRIAANSITHELSAGRRRLAVEYFQWNNGISIVHRQKCIDNVANTNGSGMLAVEHCSTIYLK